MVVVAAGGYALFRERTPAAALLALCAGVLAAAGFLLVGISHVIGRQTLFLLADANPALQEAAYMSATVVRIWVNGLAQVGLGAFAVLLSRCGLKTGLLPRSFCWYGFFSGACGLAMAIAYVPVYLYTVLIWAPWLAFVLMQRRTGRVPAALAAD
jgi:hypothetical protein